jgi:heat shock protein HslJ
MNQWIVISLFAFNAYACDTGANDAELARSDSARPDSFNTGAAPIPMDTGTLNGTWYLVAVLPSDTSTGKLPFITFNSSQKTFTGHTGCNNMSGKFTSTDSTIKIDEQIIATKMACTGYNENAFLETLVKANRYRFENGMLILMMDVTELSRWTRRAEKPAATGKT